MSFPEPGCRTPACSARACRPAAPPSRTTCRPRPRTCSPAGCPRGSTWHTAAPRTPGLDVPHGTTIVALTFAGGVVIAGDRRATMGNMIAQRDIEKVFITDSFSAVGIAGSAGIAVEMVRLFTVQLEHYEKIEGVPLSLDGKANQLAAMVRGNLGAALQGFVVIPLFAGYDTDAADPATAGRIVTFDATGGRYEEKLGFHAVGSGSVFARVRSRSCTTPRRPGRRGPHGRRVALRRRGRRLRNGRPGPHPPHLPGGGLDHRRRRGAPPGRRHRRGHHGRRDRSLHTPRRLTSVPPRSLPCAPWSRPVTMPFYSSVDQLLRDRSELARKGIARGRSVVVLTFADGVLFVAENHSPSLRKVSEIYDRIGFAAVGRYNEFESLRTNGVRLADVRGYSYDRRDVTGRWLANAYAQFLGPSFIEQQKPFEVELCVAEVGDGAGGRPALPDHLRRLDHGRAAVRRDGRADRPDQLQPPRLLPGGRRAGRRPGGGRQGPAVGAGARPRANGPARRACSG